MKPIDEIINKLHIDKACIYPYGRYKAKIDSYKIEKQPKKAKLILVTAITPTPAGEGKTTVTIGLGDALNAIGEDCLVVLREPSLGPVFGIKGGATGGGRAQVIPKDEINLHFTGDFHAITAANNLLCAIIDNHIHHGNELNISRVVLKRALDINDRQLRHIVSGLHGKSNGVPREDSFDITVACEIMAILCLSSDISDLKDRISKMIVAYNNSNEPITVKDLKSDGVIAALLKEAINPNLVQTLEGNPALIHGGPFANIAHGCNSIIATKLALESTEYVVTEAGFGADLGAEKFVDIKCRTAQIKPDACVLVATIRALKMHGGVHKNELESENVEALKRGFTNLQRHFENIKEVYKLPVVVAINRFTSDSLAEIDELKKLCLQIGAKVILSDVFSHGANGAKELAHEVVSLCKQENSFSFVYETNDNIEEKCKKIATKIYRADEVIFTKSALKDLQKIKSLGMEHLLVCIAKTHSSFSDNPTLLGAPTNFSITIKEFRICAGAGFVVAIAGDIMTMPGLPKIPSANFVDINENGDIFGIS